MRNANQYIIHGRLIKSELELMAEYDPSDAEWTTK